MIYSRLVRNYYCRTAEYRICLRTYSFTPIFKTPVWRTTTVPVQYVLESSIGKCLVGCLLHIIFVVNQALFSAALDLLFGPVVRSYYTE